MSTIYVTTQGAVIKKVEKRFIIEFEGETIASFPDFKVENILVYGNIQITTQAIRHALNNGINIVFMNSAGKFTGKISPLESKNIYLRISQFENFRNTSQCLKLAKEPISAKIHNAVVMLQRFVKNVDEELQYKEELKRINKLVETATTVDELKGIEGEASAVYFKEIKRIITPEIKFKGRSYYPAEDPFNSVLNFLYGLLSHEILSILESKGFDPYLGFFHSVEYGRISLVYDMIEPFRPVIADSIAVKVFRKKEISQEDDFEPSPEYCYLIKDSAKRVLISNYEEKMESPLEATNGKMKPRQIAIDNVNSLARFLQNGEPFQAFRIIK